MAASEVGAINQHGCNAGPREQHAGVGLRKADGHPFFAAIVTLNVTVTSAISALRKHERPWEIGDIIEVLEAWEVAQVARVRRSI
jgi:hypothetical protein